MELVTSAANIVVAGEGMLELRRVGETWSLGYGGDTLNTAIHLSRMGFRTAYLTAVGADSFSKDLRKAWTDEGLDLSLVQTDPDRQPGLYTIRTDEGGERRFDYWRSHSAAKRMFELPSADAVTSEAAYADRIFARQSCNSAAPRTRKVARTCATGQVERRSRCL